MRDLVDELRRITRTWEGGERWREDHGQRGRAAGDGMNGEGEDGLFNQSDAELEDAFDDIDYA